MLQYYFNVFSSLELNSSKIEFAARDKSIMVSFPFVRQIALKRDHCELDAGGVSISP